MDGGSVITVDDILALPAFEQVELVAPCDGAGVREVVNVGIVDCPPDINGYSNYYPNELILTNLGFAYNDAELAERSLLALMERNVSAIVVKRVYQAPISDRVRAASAESGIPVYLNDGAYYERVSYEALDLIARDREDADQARIVSGLLDHHDEAAVRRALYDLAGAMGSTVQCFALAPRSRDALSLYAARDAVASALATAQREYPLIDAVRACRFHDVILAFVSYAESGTVQADEARYRCEDLIAIEGNLLCGESAPVGLADGDLAIRQAMAALDLARMDSERLIRWWEMGFAAFSDASRRDRLYMAASTFYRQKLADYDAVHGTELMRTAECLVQALGDVKAVAEALYQHPNTVRYRLRKMKTVLGFAEASDRSFTMLLTLVFLPVSD